MRRWWWVVAALVVVLASLAIALRPKPGAPVSTPVTWDEVKRGFKITDFNIKSAIQRFKETGDLFKGVLGKGIDMRKVLQKLTD